MATQNGNSSQNRNQATVPTTVEQILSCKYPQFRIYETPIQMVKLIGVIRAINIESCEACCKIEDHSGTIKGVIRGETSNEITSKLSGVCQDRYARIFGAVRTYENEKVVLIMKMFPLDDLNEITQHLLRVKYFTLKAKAERKEKLASANTSGAALADALVVSEEGETRQSPTPQFTDLQKLVYNIVRSEHSDYGIRKRDVLRQFPSYQGHEINQTLDFLINEGIVYFSIDQEHLKATVEY